MKKMNMKLASLLLSAILTAACAPQICFAADTPAFTAADIVKQLDEPDIQQYDYDAGTATSSHDYGIAFVWHGEGAPTQIGSYAFTEANGAYVHPIETVTGAEGDIWDAVKVGETYGISYGSQKITHTVSDDLKNAPEKIYVVTPCDAELRTNDLGTQVEYSFAGIAEALMHDPNAEVKGLLRISLTCPIGIDDEIMSWVSCAYHTELVPIETTKIIIIEISLILLKLNK